MACPGHPRRLLCVRTLGSKEVLMNTIQNFLSRPGVQSSEFKIAVAIAAWLGVNQNQHVTSMLNALIIALPGIVYIISRGFAKTETRNQSGGTV